MIIEYKVIWASISTSSRNFKSGSGSTAFGTFERHLQKVLEWKKNPDVFIQELLDQDTEDMLHGIIKEKLSYKP